MTEWNPMRQAFDAGEPVDFQHARDIPAHVFLGAVQRAAEVRGFQWATRWDVAAVLGRREDLIPAAEPVPGVPDKVVLAKARRLIRRGLIGGCACGCRGDFYLTTAGAVTLACASAPASTGTEQCGEFVGNGTVPGLAPE